MTIAINLGLHGGRIGGISITGIFGNFYTKRGEFLTFKTGIPGGLGHGSLMQNILISDKCEKFHYDRIG